MLPPGNIETDANANFDRLGALPFYNFDSVASDYDQTRFLPAEVQAQIALRIQSKAALPLGSAILDAGVGTGRFALPLAELGIRVVGVDVSSNMLHRLRVKEQSSSSTRLPLRLTRGDLRYLPLATGSVGAALLVHILHLIVDWHSVLHEVRRVLQPGAPAFIAWEDGIRVPTRDIYFSLARQRGILPQHRGALNADVVRAYLRETGALIEVVDTADIRWKTLYPVAGTLDSLARRLWSNLWTVPDAEHEALMAATERWAREKYGALDGTEAAEGSLLLWKVTWPELREG